MAFFLQHTISYNYGYSFSEQNNKAQCLTLSTNISAFERNVKRGIEETEHKNHPFIDSQMQCIALQCNDKPKQKQQILFMFLHRVHISVVLM